MTELLVWLFAWAFKQSAAIHAEFAAGNGAACHNAVFLQATSAKKGATAAAGKGRKKKPAASDLDTDECSDYAGASSSSGSTAQVSKAAAAALRSIKSVTKHRWCTSRASSVSVAALCGCTSAQRSAQLLRSCTHQQEQHVPTPTGDCLPLRCFPAGLRVLLLITCACAEWM